MFELFTLCVASLLSAGGSSDPAPPGDDDYWVKFKDIRTSDGDMDPAYDMDTNYYTLTIEDEHVAEVTLTPELDTVKYNSMGMPKIKVNDKEVKYDPLKPLSLPPLPLNASIGPFEEDITLTLEDPEGGGGFLSAGKSNTYTIHIEQPPNFALVVAAIGLNVTDEKHLSFQSIPPYDPLSPKTSYQYALTEDDPSFTVELKCNTHIEGVVVAYDGEVSSSGKKHVTFAGARESVEAQCKYKSDKWTDGNWIGKIYMLSFERNAKLAGTWVSLIMMPGQGECTPNAPNEWQKGWSCVAEHREVELIAEYNNSNAEISLYTPPGQTQWRLYNGLPTSITFPEQPTTFKLVLKAGTHIRSVDVAASWAKYMPTSTEAPTSENQGPAPPAPPVTWDTKFTWDAVDTVVVAPEEQGECCHVPGVYNCNVFGTKIALTMEFSLEGNFPDPVRVGGVDIRKQTARMHLMPVDVPESVTPRHVTIQMRAGAHTYKYHLWLHYVGENGEVSAGFPCNEVPEQTARRLAATEADEPQDALISLSSSLPSRMPWEPALELTLDAIAVV